MEFLTLRHSELRVSRLCMGGCPMGRYGWGEVREKDLVDAVHAALDHGVNFFDTADVYGLGASETTLGKALAGRRGEAVIESKFGVRRIDGRTVYDNSPAYMEEALDATLRRLGTEYVDVYAVHYFDGRTPLEDVVDGLQSLRRKGKIRAFGLSNVHADDMVRLAPFAGVFSCCQDEFSLACRVNEADLRRAQARLDVTPMTWGSLGQGVLTGKYGADSRFGASDRRSRDVYVNFHGDRLLRNLRIVEAMRPVAERHGVSVAAVAVRFILDRLRDSVVLVGAKRPDQILGVLEAMDRHLNGDELRELDDVSR